MSLCVQNMFVYSRFNLRLYFEYVRLLGFLFLFYSFQARVLAHVCMCMLIACVHILVVYVRI